MITFLMTSDLYKAEVTSNINVNNVHASASMYKLSKYNANNVPIDEDEDQLPSLLEIQQLKRLVKQLQSDIEEKNNKIDNLVLENMNLRESNGLKSVENLSVQ